MIKKYSFSQTISQILIYKKQSGELHVIDGNHRITALKKCKRSIYFFFILVVLALQFN